jgi:hypothetical protein
VSVRVITVGSIAVAILATLAIAVAGCSLLGAVTTFGFEFPADGPIAALPVTVSDASGTVVGTGQAPDGHRPLVGGGFSTVPEDPNAIVVHWIGGACDASVAMSVRDTGTITVHVVTTRRPGACDLLGISRALLIQFSHPIDASRTSVDFDP